MITLTDDQKAAEEQFISFLFSDDNVMLINGFSGVGKTTLLRHLVERIPETINAVNALSGTSVYATYTVHVTATTNQAVAEIRNKFPDELLDRISTGTIDSKLSLVAKRNWQTGGITMQPQRNSAPPSFGRDVIFVDEASMLEPWKYDYLLKAAGSNTKIVFVQDPAQILAITSEVPRPTSPLETHNLPYTVWIREIVRQQASATGLHPIAEIGLALRNAVLDKTTPELGSFLCDSIQVLTREEMEAKVDEHTQAGRFSDGSSKFLAYTNSVVTGANEYIRSQLTDSPILSSIDNMVSAGSFKCNSTRMGKEQVLLSNQQTLNNLVFQGHQTYEFYQGYSLQVEVYHDTQLGIELLYLPHMLRKRVLDHLWQNSYKAEYFNAKEKIVDIRPSFASTVHKAQGSTFHTAFIDLGNIQGVLEREGEDAFNRLLYVAFTRATDQVYIVE